MATTNGAAHAAFDPSSDPVPLFLDGKTITTDRTFDVVSPNDNKVCWKCSAASEQDALNAVASAEKAFKTWSKSKPAQRRDILLKAAQLLKEKEKDAFLYTNTETGAANSMFQFEFNAAYEGCLTIAGLIPTVQGSVLTPSGEGKSALLWREPYGVVLAIAPWNAPHVLGMRSFLGAIAMGNTVVLKGPEASPATYWNFAQIMQQAGLPPGVLNTIYHDPKDAAPITNALIDHPAVKKVNFTGSTNVGSIIAARCGKMLKPCLMELGGKAPSIVCGDANLDNAALQCALGAFLHAGQICMATERIIVESSVVEEFKKKLCGTMDQVFGKEGPAPVLVSSPGVKKNKELLSDALSKGARAIYGDANAEEASNTRMRPVIVENVNKDMSIYHTESFGPTVSLYSIPAGPDFEEKALELANDTDYGLASAVFTEDLRKGLRLAKGIETGGLMEV
ncbi:hypothetical protein LTS08_001835 [Lithohypha guttulata]|nr:hypothetical protein LTS08_001835 [Lithohypha guttulata]